MTDNISFNNTFKMLESAMNVSKQRHSLLVSNVANLDTPGYKAKDLDFKSTMARALNDSQRMDIIKTDAGHMGQSPGSSISADVVEEEGEWNGYNWMNVDQVMTKLTENNLIYRTSAEALLRKIAIMKEVLREGGR
jgi:flagellar basal-body rod protein FlgB